MIAGRILPAETSVIAATRYAREDNARVFIAPHGQVIIRQRALPGWERVGWAGFRRQHGGALQAVLAVILIFAAGFWCGWMSAFLSRFAH